MAKISDLIAQGRHDEVWQTYCGFLDLSLDEFMSIQERLLREQLHFIAASPLARSILGDKIPGSVEEFRKQVRLTTYADYAPYLDQKREDVLAAKPVAWAHTSGRSGQFKWAPYTARAFANLGAGIMTAFILCAARRRGEVRLEPGDVLVYNGATRPYISGFALYAVPERFDFRFVPPPERAEKMSFQERIEEGFKVGLRTGIDLIGSITAVMMKVGERFAQGGRSMRLSAAMLHPAVFLRIGRAMVRSRLEGRPMLPKDIWKIKGMVVGGTDTGIYRERLAYYWGVEPHESYGCTEITPVMATQAWTRKGLYFLPDAGFYEFIPEEEWARSKQDPTYIPRTILLDEVKTGERYEIVVTNFHGGPFLRYRLYDLVRFVSLRDDEAGIALPSMVFEGRTNDLIDLAGFTGLIDEKLVWQALENAGITYEDWLVRKEVLADHTALHLYIELKDGRSADMVAQQVHHEMQRLNPFYADIEKLLEYVPLQVTALSPGTFARYMAAQQAAGADLAHLKPPHMNAPDHIIAELLRYSRDGAV